MKMFPQIWITRARNIGVGHDLQEMHQIGKQDQKPIREHNAASQDTYVRKIGGGGGHKESNTEGGKRHPATEGTNHPHEI